MISEEEHKGRVIYDATACPQDIAYPTEMGQSHLYQFLMLLP
jgi:hypothetical protein